MTPVLAIEKGFHQVLLTLKISENAGAKKEFKANNLMPCLGVPTATNKNIWECRKELK